MIDFKINEFRESLADIEHQQWRYWSMNLSLDLMNIRRELMYEENVGVNNAVIRINAMLEKWLKNWKPYNELTEEEKEKDREWADKVLDSISIKCLGWHCDSMMIAKERTKPKDDGFGQVPDLICSNCGSVYQFKGYKKLWDCFEKTPRM